MSRKQELTERASRVGLYVTTYSPGDGHTRYRFSHNDSDDFACKALYTSRGIYDAQTWLGGYMACYYASERDRG